MADTFTTVTSTSFFGRIRNALIGFIVGPVLLVVAGILIFWNESHSVRVTKSLKEGAAGVVEAPEYSAGNDGILVHVTGDTATDGKLRDTQFGVEAEGIRLDRKVLVYAWTEHETSRTTTTVTGSKQTTKTYTYEKEWLTSLPKSSKFKEPTGHENPAQLRYEARSFPAEKVSLGSYTLDRELIGKLTETKAVSLDKDAIQVPEGAQVSDDEIYIGADRTNPAVGDLRISELVVPNGTVSVVAGQGPGPRLAPYTTRAGEPIGLVETGSKTAAEMFAHAQSANRVMTWIIRGAGFVLLLVGFLLLLGPISTMSSIVPFFGGIVEAGLFVVSLLAAIVIWALLTAAAWMVARPIVGGILFVIGLVALVFAVVHIKRGAARRHAQASASAAPVSA